MLDKTRDILLRKQEYNRDLYPYESLRNKIKETS